MKCDRHIWDTDDKEWCWRCEEITINEIKKSYENKFRNNSLQRDDRDQEIDPISIGTQKK
jgi:hypothetical protein